MIKKGIYRTVAIEICENRGASNADYRCRPLPGQGVPVIMKVECSRPMRREMVASRKVAILKCQVIDKEGGTEFLYSHFSWPYKLVSRDEALDMIAQHKLGF